MMKKEKRKALLSPVCFGSSFPFQETERDPQPREMLIRQGKDFSLPIRSPAVRTTNCNSNSHERSEGGDFGSSKFYSQKSQSRRSIVEKHRIEKGVRIQIDGAAEKDQRFVRIKKKPYFQHVDNAENHFKPKENAIRVNQSKLLRLMKTKNTLLTVKADITDFKTKVD